MNPATTIRSELEAFMNNHNVSLTQFAELANMNCGTISTILRGQRPVAVQQLDKITEGMGLAPGSFYENYLQEYFIDSTPNWRRLRPFINRCAELNKLTVLESAVNNSLDNLTYAPLLFETAEKLFHQGKKQAASILYRNISESEKYQHSERLAICQYRLFNIHLGEDQDKNLHIAIQFEPYVERLDEADQLDALKDLANLFYSLRRWKKVEKMAATMEHKAKIQYTLKHQHSRKDGQFKEPSKPLFGYVLYAQLLQGAAQEEYRNYELALHYVSLYADTSWVIEDDHEAESTKNQFRLWAEANSYLYQLLNGKTEVLDNFLNCISTQKDEILPALFKVIQAANRYDINIDNVLQQYHDQISHHTSSTQKINNNYSSQVISDRFAHFLADMAKYNLNKDRYEIGFNNMTDSLIFATRIYSGSCIIKNVTLFERCRYAASEKLISKYQKLIDMVVNDL